NGSAANRTHLWCPVCCWDSAMAATVAGWEVTSTTSAIGWISTQSPTGNCAISASASRLRDEARSRLQQARWRQVQVLDQVASEVAEAHAQVVARRQQIE